MSSSTGDDPASTQTELGTLKVKYAKSPKRRRFQRYRPHAARGFVRRQIRGRVPTTRPPLRG